MTFNYNNAYKQIRKPYLVGLFLLFSMVANAQFDYKKQYYYPEFDAAHADMLFFRIENQNFFRNYEYFGNFIEGYTMIGNDIEPSLVYYAGDRVRLRLGAHFKRYSGEKDFSEVLPIISMHARLTDNLEMIIGSLRGSIHHEMYEPIFDYERLYSSPVENGLQFLYNTNKWHIDTWVNWEQYVNKGDSIPEKFMFGFSSSYAWLRDSTNWQIKTPVNLLATHCGGQISDYEEPMQSLANAAIALDITRHPTNSRIKDIDLKICGLGYKDLTKKSGLPFNTGKALYTTIGINTRQLEVMAGYFVGINFVAPRGSALFQSVSSYIPDFYQRTRNLFTGRVHYTHKLYKDIQFGMMAEGYYDANEGQLEYAYGVNIAFMPSWFLLKKAMH